MASQRVVGAALVLFAGAAMIGGVQVTQPLLHLGSPPAVLADDDDWVWQQQQQDELQDELNQQMMQQAQQQAEEQNEQAQQQAQQAEQQGQLVEQQANQ